MRLELDHSTSSLVAGAEARRRRFPRSRAARVGFVLAAGLLLAAVVATLVPVPYDAITPGSGIEVATLVHVPKAQVHEHPGAVVLTDVEIVPLRAIDYLYYALSGGDQVVGRSELTGSSTSAQYQEQGVIDMANARQAATVVALRALGYPVKAVPSGVIVYESEPGSPAAAHLAVGQVITAVDGVATRTLAALQQALSGDRPGQAVRLTLRHYGEQATTTRRFVLGKVRLAEAKGVASVHCLPASASTRLARPPAGSVEACLGITAPTVQSEQAYTTGRLPFPVRLSSNGIVGPSAGLSFTLGLLSVLSRTDITGGLKVAATGTMSVTGQVGQVGGVAQKTAAVEAAGAQVFLVPSGQAGVARAHARSSLKVFGVSSLGQALGVLQRLGGHLGPLAKRARP